MRAKIGWLLVLLAGCGEGGPPLDELPLRDALRADPEVVAALPDDARARLAERLETARKSDATADPLDETGPPALLVAALDRARERRGREPLLLGELQAGGLVRALAGESPARDAPLPAIEGPAGPTAEREARALAGAARPSLHALLEASGARHLRRVVGWPIGAAAIGDTVYLNASWLVALAGPDDQADAGAAPRSPTASPTVRPSRPGPASGAPVTARVQAQTQPSPAGPDGGASDPTPAPPYDPSPTVEPESADPSCDEACSAFPDSCAASDSGDSCTSSDDPGDSCSGTPDDGGQDSPDSCGSSDEGDSCGSGDGDACASSGGADDCSNADVGDSASGCQVAPRRRRGGHPSPACIFLPLAFLFLRGRR
jgi:hypothetical protein